MMEAVEEEHPDSTSYILQALNIIKVLWTMNVHIGKVTKPSRATWLLRRLHLQQCDDDNRIYLKIRTGIDFRIIVFFLCDQVICPYHNIIIKHLDQMRLNNFNIKRFKQKNNIISKFK